MSKNTPAKKKMGRPLLEVDLNLIESLAAIHCTKQEIASVIGCHIDTLYGRDDISEAMRKGDDIGKESIKRKMHTIALGGNVMMLIWLSKQRLGYRDKQPEEATQVHFNVYTNEIPK